MITGTTPRTTSEPGVGQSCASLGLRGTPCLGLRPRAHLMLSDPRGNFVRSFMQGCIRLVSVKTCLSNWLNSLFCFALFILRGSPNHTHTHTVALHCSFLFVFSFLFFNFICLFHFSFHVCLPVFIFSDFYEPVFMVLFIFFFSLLLLLLLVLGAAVSPSFFFGLRCSFPSSLEAAFLPLSLWVVMLSHPPPFGWCCFSPSLGRCCFPPSHFWLALLLPFLHGGCFLLPPLGCGAFLLKNQIAR